MISISFDGVEVDSPCSLRIGMDKRQVFAMKSDSLYTKGKQETKDP